MALGTYDREERKKLAYNANGTTSEEKDDRSAQNNAEQKEPAAAPIQPTQVAPAPQVQNVGTVNVPQVNASAQPKQEQSNDELTQQNSGATPPQKVVTNQGPQSNVIPGGEIKNNQGEVNQETGTSSESQVGPESSAGGENYQWAGAPQGDVTSTYNDLIGPQNATPPLNAPVREFGGYNFSTVTPSGKALTDSDMDAYFDMLKRKSEETGASVEDLDKIAGNLLVGKIPSAEQSNQEDAPAVENVQENGNNTTNNGAATTTTDNGAPSTSGTSSGKPKVTVMPPAAKPAAGGTSAPTSEEQQYYDNWKDFSLEQLKDMLPANSGIPAKKAALERLISEKGGSVTAPAQGTAAGEDEKKQVTLTDEEKKEKEDAKTALQQYSGHVDMTNRRLASEEAMREAGWNAVGDQGAYPILETIEDSKGNKHKVLMTPIYADGSVLPRDMYQDFVKSLKGFDDEADLLNRDTHGIIIKVDANNDDVDAIDDLTKKALKGELVKDLDSDLDDEYDPNKSAARKKLVEAQNETQKKIDELEELMGPDVPLNSVALNEATKKLEEHDADTEKVKKRQRTAGIIANIGDILQGFANLAGAWYGAKSSELTSLSAASNAAYERELTKREKRREELSKSIDSVKADLKKNKNTELSEWVKRLDEINKEIRKWDADAEKVYRASKLKRKEEREKTMQQNQRRAVEYAEKKALAKYQSDLRKEENAQKGSIQSGLIAQRANARNNSNKKKGKGGKNKTGGGSKPASRR